MFKILKLILLICLLKNKLVNSYFITVDETKFHLVKSYLCRYGYMNENVCKQHADDSLKFMQNNARDIYRGLVIFQTMFNITRSGKIDEDTIMKMAKPRCGNKDFDLQFSSSKFLSYRTNDFSLLRKGLKKLTYSIRKYNPYLNRYSKSLSNEAVEMMVDKAFNAWLKHLYGDVRVTKLEDYEEFYDNSNITVYFAEGNHGDSMLFDGIDGELAHSCSLSNTQSPFRGHVHLDDSENWNKGNRLMGVLMHQIGHLFGLDHSSNPKSIMSPLFNFDTDNILEEDIRNLRMILGLESKHRHYNMLQSTSALPSTISTSESTTVPTTTTTTYSTTSTTTTTTTTTSTTTVTSTMSTTNIIPTSAVTSTPITTTPTLDLTSTAKIELSTQTSKNESESEESSEEETTAELDLQTEESLDKILSSTTTLATTVTKEEEEDDYEEETETEEILTTIQTTTLNTETSSEPTTTVLLETSTQVLETTSTNQEFLLNITETNEYDKLNTATFSNAPELLSKQETNFITNLFETAWDKLNNKTNNFNLDSTLSPALNSTIYIIANTTLDSKNDANQDLDLDLDSEDGSENSATTTEDSEYQELLNIIGTSTITTSTLSTTNELSSLSSKYSELNSDEEEDDDDEEISSTTTTTTTQTTTTTTISTTTIVNLNLTTSVLSTTSSDYLSSEIDDEDYFENLNETVLLITNPADAVNKPTSIVELSTTKAKIDLATTTEEIETDASAEVTTTTEEIETDASAEVTTTTEEIETETSTNVITTIAEVKIETTTESTTESTTEATTTSTATTIPTTTTSSSTSSSTTTTITITTPISTKTTTTTTESKTHSTTFIQTTTEKLESTFEYKKLSTSSAIQTSLEEQPADLCNDPVIDAITRTEWGNAFIFKGEYIWHIRGLTKWRLFDYEGWPKKISNLFPSLPGYIDSAYLYDDQYHFTKNQTVWKYKIVLSYPPKYVLVKGYPKSLKEEYPDMPFKSVDSAFSIASSIFFFKDYDFWQSDWNTNVTGKIPFKTNAAVSWRNPRLDNSLTEPLAYIISNSSMYKFNYWSIPISQEALDIRYFLFDCVQANYKPHNPLFLGPSYKQAFLADDVYSKEVKSSRQAPSYLARMARNSEKNATSSQSVNQDSPNILIKSLIRSNSASKLNCSFLNIIFLLILFLRN